MIRAAQLAGNANERKVSCGLRGAKTTARTVLRTAKYSASFHIFCSLELKMNGISTDNFPFAMPILARARWHDVSITHASAHPAAEAISEKGRPRRRSVKNRKSFDCFKSAEGIRFSVGARPTPKSFHRGGFWVTFCPNKR